MPHRRQTITALAIAAAASALLAAQDLAPGFVDPEPILRAAREAIGTDQLRCVTLAGTGLYTGMVGQQRYHGFEVDWPRGVPLTNYVRTMNWEAGTLTESFDREPGRNPASWRWGMGWLDGTPVQSASRQSFYVDGDVAWHRDGDDGAPRNATTRTATTALHHHHPANDPPEPDGSIRTASDGHSGPQRMNASTPAS